MTGIVFGLAPAFNAPERGPARRAQGCQPRIDRAPAHLGPQRAGRVRDRVRLRPARRRGSADPQLRPRARRRSGLPPVAARSRSASIPTASYSTREQRIAYFDDVLRRVREIARRRGAPASPTRCRSARNRTWGVRAKGVVYERGRVPTAFVRDRQRRLSRGDGHSAARPDATSLRPTRRPSEPVIVINESMAQRALARTGSDRQSRRSTRAAPERARRRRRRRRAAPRARAGVGQRDVHPAAPVRRPAVHRSGGPLDRCRRRRSSPPFAQALKPLAPNLPGERRPHDAAAGRSSRCRRGASSS